MSYERGVGLGTNGTSNAGGAATTGVHLIAPMVQLKRVSQPTPAPGSYDPTGWPSTPPPSPADEPVREEPEPNSFMTTREAPSSMPWIIGIGAVSVLGIGGFLLWRYMSKEEESGPAPTPVPPPMPTAVPTPAPNPKYMTTVYYKFEGDWSMDDILRSLGKAMRGKHIGSGTELRNYMRDLDFEFGSREKADRFGRRAVEALKAAGAKRVRYVVTS
jgi:hypothetical protein